MTKEETKAEVPTQSQPPKKNGRQQIAGRRQNQKAKTLPKLNENQKPAAQTTAAAAPARAGTKKAETAQEPRRQGRTRKKPQGDGQVTMKSSSKEKLKIISLGGLNEIGKNLTVIEYQNDMFLVDCGLAFPDNEMLGIDVVIPDITYLLKNAEKVRGIVLTHGHEDHIGAIPYVLKQLNVPVYGTRLTLGILRNKLEEHGLLNSSKLNEVKAGDEVKLGCFKVELIRTNHSIPDSVAFAIKTPVGTVIHTGDFKIDSTPIHGEMMDLTRLGELGKKGVLALICDSTNAERPGMTMSERKVGAALDDIFRDNDKRIIVATFASNVHRVQQIIHAAARYGRKVAVSGRSMVNIVNAACELGCIDVPKGTLVEIDAVNRLPSNRVVIITTGSQGEPMSALSRMAFGDHRKIEINSNDMVVISANPIPGNEKTVNRVINELLKLGADVIYNSIIADVHVSGHACQEEIKMVMALTKPKFFFPMHGEYKHLVANRHLAEQVGIPPENIIISDIGKVIEVDGKSARINGCVPSGRVLVDGLGVGDVGNIVLRDRQHLAQDGLIVVVATMDQNTGALIAGPDIVSRGFVYVREAEALMEDVKNCAKKSLMYCEEHQIKEWNTIKSTVKDNLTRLLMERTKRKPMILPIIMEV